MPRPDDIWLTTLTQFNFYVKGRAEEMRYLFVTHEGKKELIFDIDPATPLSKKSIRNFVLKMTCLMEEQLVNPGLRE